MIPLPAGLPHVYDIALSFRTGDEEETDRCLAILPPPEDWSGNLPVTCLRNSASLYIARDFDVDCSATFPEGASCSVDAEGFTLMILRYNRVDAVELQFKSGETTFSRVTVEPTYATHHPDGPDCPGSCEVASAVVSFDALNEPMPP